MAKTETSETEERTEGGDAPLIDLNEADLKKLINRAKKRGYITVDELKRRAAAGPDVLRADRGRDVVFVGNGDQHRRGRGIGG
jgi:RNA polymerase primary sigma factor